MSSSDYSRRIGRVVEHIRSNLEADLSLEKLAKVAHFSPYHFHRIFRAATGETLAAFARRARLERAVFLIRAAPERSLSSIALEVGFNTPSDFSRVFRRVYGVSPSSWDCKSRLDGAPDIAVDARRAGAEAPAPALVVSRDPCRLAYLTVRDPWRGGRLAAGYQTLLAAVEGWRNRALIGSSWDSEKSTPLERVTYDLGLVVGPDFEPVGNIAVRELPGVEAVEIHCTSLMQVALAWDYLYTVWLPGSDHEPADLPALKRFRRTPEVLDDAAWDVDCSIALRPQQP
ncbi:MAG: AraC family transcriptional regulator [bacterium]|nr:AraC family transcriptional regulator [bacterium]